MLLIVAIDYFKACSQIIPMYLKYRFFHFSIVLILLIEIACYRSSSNIIQPNHKLAFVVLKNRLDQSIRVAVEVARTQEETAKGLMFRTNLAEKSGMLFIFNDEQLLSFWMKNTYIPLDMIFIKSDKTIAGVIENAAPLTTEPRKIGTKSQYVLEVNGGFYQQFQINPQSSVEFEHVE